ncbi:MAG: glycoside hydrolase family 16 protein, partial [Solirubrobacteraceae bacterium]
PRARGIRSVRFFIDDRRMNGPTWRTMRRAPWAMNGTDRHHRPLAFNLGSLPDMSHTITVAVSFTGGGVRVLSASLKVLAGAGSAVTRRIAHDDFNGRGLDTSRWLPFDGVGNSGNGLRRPSATTLDGHGNLVITASMQNGTIVSGGVQMRRAFTYGYVRFRVRTMVDPAANTSGVVLLWPQSEQRQEGEEDIYETLGYHRRKPFWAFLHDKVLDPTVQDWRKFNADASQWQTMAMRWTPREIRIYRDGILAWRDVNPQVVPTTPRKVSIQLDPPAKTPLIKPISMFVSSISVYQ